jgi:glycosyltransferase involved in cell wall biosynthesis
VAEGFGLPLIKAPHYNLPIIAKDIPIIRELTGNYLFYFGKKINTDFEFVIKNLLINIISISIKEKFLTI